MVDKLLLALLIALVGFCGGWSVQSWRYGAKENAIAQQKLVDQRKAALEQNRRFEAVAAAQSASALRESELRRDADRSRGAIVSLRSATAAAMRDAAASQAACVDRATALGELLDTSAEQYRDLAEKADRHVSDLKTLSDGWPK